MGKLIKISILVALAFLLAYIFGVRGWWSLDLSAPLHWILLIVGFIIAVVYYYFFNK